MSTTAFALRAEYESTFVDASVAYGPLAHSFHVAEVLKQGNGSIVTDDPLLTAALHNLDGGNGPLFKTVAVGENPVFARIPEGAMSVVDPAAPVPESAKPVEVPAQVEAVHGQASEYEPLTATELKGTADERRLDVKASATKAELVAALEADDQKT